MFDTHAFAALPTAPKRMDRPLLLTAALGGAALDIGIRGGINNAMVSLGIALAVVALVRTDHSSAPRGRWLLILALVPAVMLSLRSSPWLASSNLGASVALLVGGILYGRSGSIFDSGPMHWIRRASAALVVSLTGWTSIGSFLRRTGTRHTTRAGRVLRATLVAAPFVLIATFLLQAGDVIFAELITPDLDIGGVGGHLVLVTGFGAVVVGLRAAAENTSVDRDPDGSFGLLEVVTMLGLAASVLVLFVIAQLVAATSTGDRLIRNAGMTPAQYARSGFFQLCWATLAIVVLLVVVRRVAAPAAMRRRAVRIIGAFVPLLAVGLVVVSLRRMVLYDDAFGLTMLRLWATGATVWLGALLLMMTIRSLGVGRDQHWIGGTVLMVAVALVLVADIANPEAFIVRHNAARTNAGASLDLSYLSALSDDAVPQIVHTFGGRGNRRTRLQALRCGHDARGVTRFNLSAQTAAEVRRTHCP